MSQRLLAPWEEDTVTLKGGLTVPVVAWWLTLDLEQRGVPLANDEHGRFIFPDPALLTATERAGVHAWRRHIAALIAYRCPESELEI